MRITLKDGSVKEYEGSRSALDIAKDISEGLARAATSAKVNGDIVDLRKEISEDCELELLTFDSEDGKGAFWHTTSHIMAQAVKRLYPETKLAIGPSIDNGFYYDLDRETPFVAEDLEKIETEMKKIVKENLSIERFTKSREDAIAYFKENGEPYKVELVEDLPVGEEISFYRQGELGLFMMHEAGPGFPFFLPKGMVLKNTLMEYWRELHKRNGYVEIATPIILSRHLWENSGHWDHYKDNMYTTVIDEEDFAVKPMNCPGGMLVYKSEPRSYKDLPLRAGEIGLVHRHEKSGALHGLFRVRCFNQDDAHIFMMPEQIRDEIKGVARLIDEVYSLFGFKYHVELSTRPEDSMGSDEDWEMATEGLRGALDDLGLDYVVNEGDGAFYGPKIDFHLEDSIGRTWQCGTIQLDMQMPQRFDLEYTGADGEKHRPIMIHRVAFGSIERFIGILIEHFAGAFPTWLAPVQVKVLPISEKHLDYGKKVLKELEAAGIRAEIDERAEKIGYKIREAQMNKIPYMLVVGAKEEEQELVAVRSRFAGDEGQKGISEFIEAVKEEIASKTQREIVKED